MTELTWEHVSLKAREEWNSKVQEAEKLLATAEKLFGWIDERNGMLEAAKSILAKYATVADWIADAAPDYMREFRNEVCAKRDMLEGVLNRLVESKGPADHFSGILHRHVRLCCLARVLPVIAPEPAATQQTDFLEVL